MVSAFAEHVRLGGSTQSIGGIRGEENRFNQMWKNQNRIWKGDLYKLLQEWRSNPYLKELTSPAYASRGVAMAAESAQAGAKASKREATDFASAQGLGRAFTARQHFSADQGARAATSAAAQVQNVTAAQVGAAAEAQYAQTSSDIINQYNTMELQRKSEHLDSYRRYEMARQARSDSRRAMVMSLGGMALGMAAGSAGMFGLESGMQGAGAGLMAGGVLSGQMGNAAMGYQMYAGASRMPNVYGFDPVLNYVYGQGPYMMGAQQSPYMQMQNSPYYLPRYYESATPGSGQVAG